MPPPAWRKPQRAYIYDPRWEAGSRANVRYRPAPGARYTQSTPRPFEGTYDGKALGMIFLAVKTPSLGDDMPELTEQEREEKTTDVGWYLSLEDFEEKMDLRGKVSWVRTETGIDWVGIPMIQPKAHFIFFLRRHISR